MFRRLLPFLFVMLPIATAASTPATSLVFFGTYTRKESQGIYVARFNSTDGSLSHPQLAARGSNPTFLARHPRLPVLYAIGDRKNEQGGAEGVLFAYTIDPATGALTALNSIPAGGGPLCYIQVHPSGGGIVVASYHGGYVASYSLSGDGSLGELRSLVKHTGKGPHPQQDAPHAHCIDFAPGGEIAFSADLGTDTIFRYPFDQATATLTAAGEPHLTRPGAGPRHLAYHPNGRFAYAINELLSTVTVFALDEQTTLREIQDIDTIQDDFTGRRWGAEIAIHPNGKFLYASNRADHESIAVFSIDQNSGHLTFVSHAREGIRHPRHFAIDPSGRWLLCANHDADDTVVFAIDPESGRLTPTAHKVSVPSAVCVLFAP